MSSVSLQSKSHKFQEESSDLETLLLELGFLCEDWNAADPDSLLETETFTSVTAYDALNRATSIKTPHNADIPASEILPGYNEASLLEKVDVKLRGATTATNFVQNIDYDAKGQRERIRYGNGSTTGYAYDEKTFRLKRLLTTRNNGADVLQDLNYTYDAVGNVTQIDDNAQQTVFFNGSAVSPSQKFEYDALYRLVKATGREHVSVNADSEPEAEGYNAAQISPQDGTAMRNYACEWEYDSVGNILSIIHRANGNAWTRTNAYATDSNRLTSSAVGSTSASFSYNAHGSMTSMPHLSAMDWDFAEQLCHITCGTTEAYYSYDGSGIRTRKVVEKNGVVETRLYLGGFEIWRKTVNGTLETERETLHVMDDQKRIALVETLTMENGNRIASPVPVQRYQLDNHLGSASLELDDSANIISYEEFYPYGDTCYRAGRSASEVSQKRYRYTGKEKDEESSLYYCEQRYYAAHISRWVSTDPTWLADGINLYAYVNGNPVSGVDPSGTQTVEDDKVEPVLDDVVNPPLVVPKDEKKAENSLGEKKLESQDSLVNPNKISDERDFGEGNTVGAQLEKKAIESAASGNSLGIWGWSIAAALWETLGPEEISQIADKKFNSGKDVSAGELVSGGLEVAGIVPAFKVLKGAKPVVAAASKNLNVVYRSVQNGVTKYVGITNNFERRAAEHFASKGMFIEGIQGLENLARKDARAVEQTLIDHFGLSKNGGSLINKINSIAKTNPVYDEAKKRGAELLKRVNFPGF